MRINTDIKEIEILSKTFTVNKKEMSEENWGLITHSSQEITLNSALAKDCSEVTLFHEILHALDVSMNLDLTEHQIVALSESIVDTIKRNKELILS